MQKKTIYGRIVSANAKKFQARAFLKPCPRCFADHRGSTKIMWYGYETIGPRVYGLYQCPMHGLIKERLIEHE